MRAQSSYQSILHPVQHVFLEASVQDIDVIELLLLYQFVVIALGCRTIRVILLALTCARQSLFFPTMYGIAMI